MGGKSGRKKKKKAILLAPSSSQFLTSHEPHCWGRRWEGGGTHRAGARKGKMGRARTVSRFWPFFVFCFSFGWLHTSLIPPLRETGFVRNEVLFFLSETISND